MSMLLEDALPLVKYQGLNTNKNVVLGGTLAVTGATTLPAGTTIGGVLGVQGAVNASSGATVALTAAQSGQVFLMDAATGIAYTLPTTPVAGMSFTFIVSVSVTSNAHSVTAVQSSIFLSGAVQSLISASATTKAFFANGTSNYTLSMNGSTTGGLIGTTLTFTAISATVWNVTGLVAASGALATPIT